MMTEKLVRALRDRGSDDENGGDDRKPGFAIPNLKDFHVRYLGLKFHRGGECLQSHDEC